MATVPDQQKQMTWEFLPAWDVESTNNAVALRKGDDHRLAIFERKNQPAQFDHKTLTFFLVSRLLPRRLKQALALRSFSSGLNSPAVTMVAAFAAAAREFLRLALGALTRLGRLAAQLWGFIAQRAVPLTTTNTNAAAQAVPWEAGLRLAVLAPWSLRVPTVPAPAPALPPAALAAAPAPPPSPVSSPPPAPLVLSPPASPGRFALRALAPLPPSGIRAPPNSPVLDSLGRDPRRATIPVKYFRQLPEGGR
ncbi:hypothetical protein B0H65DRAFT_576201 [Neurospora tetraspora]|uniref:Uncharacterized protein n=1 Tax=Neurospora tetraspora TaxID=94610 RepID=A0AAE0JD94_9PEZI|nr:hypothetical protein B0H65DRAFT_576201 [Neurospora tetraspora]